jgi:hypothetical protein
LPLPEFGDDYLIKSRLAFIFCTNLALSDWLGGRDWRQRRHQMARLYFFKTGTQG